MWVSAYECRVHKSQKRTSEPLLLEVQKTAIYVGAEN